MASVLTINGVAVGRYGLLLNRLSVTMDGVDTLEFTQLACALPGRYRQGQSVTLTVDGTLVFTGVIVSLHPSGVGSGPINVGYRALGLNWLANQVWITAADGTGKIVYNLPQSDPNYIASQSGLNVGQILTQVYDLHAAALSAVGITSFNSSDLANLTVVPPDPVVMTGRLWNNVLQLITQWHNSYGSWITPAGVIRHENLLTLPNGTSAPVTFTLDALDGSSNPCTLDAISEDFSECYTQVVIRGYANVQGAYLSLAQGTITPAWTAAQQSAWSYSQFIQPPGAYETGTVGSMTSTSTTLTVTATNPIPLTYTSTTWWSSMAAEVWAYNPVATSNIFGEQRRVTANTAPSSNTYTLTVDTAFNNSGYTNYQIRGLSTFQNSTTAVDVWRKYWIVPTYVNQNLEQQFSHSVPWSGSDGALIQTLTPQADICFTSGGVAIQWPMTFQLIPWGTGTFTTQATVTATISGGAVTGFTGLSGGAGYPPSSTTIAVAIVGVGSGATATATSNSSGVITAVTLGTGGTGYSTAPSVLIGISPGYIEFNQPVCAAYCSQTTLNAGGSSIPAPTDILVLVPYSQGAISVQAPSSGYQGTAYTVNGVQRTLYLDYPEWVDYAATSQYTTLAQQKLYCVMNTVVEGSLTYYGKQATFFLLGQAINIAGNGYTTGYESINAPARSVTLDYCPDGGANEWVTRISFSTRMKPYTGDRLYAHPSYGSQRALASGWFNGQGGAMALGFRSKMGGMDWSAGGNAAFSGDQGGGDDTGFSLGPAEANTFRGRPQSEERQAQHERRLAREADQAQHAAAVQQSREQTSPQDQMTINRENDRIAREIASTPQEPPPPPPPAPEPPAFGGASAPGFEGGTRRTSTGTPDPLERTEKLSIQAPSDTGFAS